MPKSPTPTIHYSARLPADVHAGIARIADEAGESRNAVVVEALRSYIERWDADAKQNSANGEGR